MLMSARKRSSCYFASVVGRVKKGHFAKHWSAEWTELVCFSAHSLCLELANTPCGWDWIAHPSEERLWCARPALHLSTSGHRWALMLSIHYPHWASFVMSSRSVVSFPQDVDTDRAASLDCRLTSELWHCSGTLLMAASSKKDSK